MTDAARKTASAAYLARRAAESERYDAERAATAPLVVDDAAVVRGLAAGFADDSRERDAYEDKGGRSYVLARIGRVFAANARARAFTPDTEPERSPLFWLRDFPLPRVNPPAEWTHRQKQAALAAAMVESEHGLNARQSALRSAIVGGPDMPEVEGPAMDDCHFEETSAAGAALSYFEANDALRELIAREGGRIVEARVAAEALAAFELSADYTRRLADALEAAGLRVWFANPGEDNPQNRPVRPSVTFVPFGEPARAIALPNVQRVNFFPTVAAGRRAPIQRGLAYLMQREPLARMMTITSGPRERADARLENLRHGSKAFAWRLGQVFRHRWFTRHARLWFRGIEFGTPTARMLSALGELMGESAAWFMHIHAHCVYVPTRWFHPAAWSRFREWMRLRLAALARFQAAQEETPKLKWKAFRVADRRDYHDARLCAAGVAAGFAQPQHHAELGTMIGKAAEAVKYPVKPADLEELLEKAGPGAIRTFYEQTRGLHLAQPSGELAALLRDLRETGRRIVRLSVPDGSILAIRKDWNRPSPDNPNARDIQGRPGRAARLGRLRRNLRPAALARFERKQTRKTVRAARDLIATIQKQTDTLARRRERIEDRARALDYWRARASAAELENRTAAAFRASDMAAARADELERLQADLAEIEAAKRKAERRMVHMLETFPQALHAAGIDCLPAGVVAMMTRMGAHCTLPEPADEKPAAPRDAGEAREKKPLVNRLLAITAPCALAGSRVTQPFAVVVGYCGDFSRITEQNGRVRDIRAQTQTQLTLALGLAAEMDAAAPAREAARSRPNPGSHYPRNFPGGFLAKSAAEPAAPWIPGLADTVHTALATL